MHSVCPLAMEMIENYKNVRTELGRILGKSPPFPSSFLIPSHLEMAGRHVTLGMESS